jgi:hypothetical protein
MKSHANSSTADDTDDAGTLAAEMLTADGADFADGFIRIIGVIRGRKVCQK